MPASLCTGHWAAPGPTTMWRRCSSSRLHPIRTPTEWMACPAYPVWQLPAPSSSFLLAIAALLISRAPEPTRTDPAAADSVRTDRSGCGRGRADPGLRGRHGATHRGDRHRPAGQREGRLGGSAFPERGDGSRRARRSSASRTTSTGTRWKRPRRISPHAVWPSSRSGRGPRSPGRSTSSMPAGRTGRRPGRTRVP